MHAVAALTAALIAMAIAASTAAAAPADIDLAQPPMVRLTIPGTNELVAIAAGDVNGDGHPDVAYADQSDSNKGREYNGLVRVVLGPVSDATDPVAGPGFNVYGPRSGGCTGRQLAAGDVNGDGFGDLVIGGNAGCDAWDKRGRTLVVLGSSQPRDVDAAARFLGLHDPRHGRHELRRQRAPVRKCRGGEPRHER